MQVLPEDAVRVVQRPSGAPDHIHIGGVELHPLGATIAIGGENRQIAAWDFSVHRIDQNKLAGGLVGFVLDNGHYIPGNAGVTSFVESDRDRVVRAWRGGGQEIVANEAAPLPSPVATPDRPIRTPPKVIPSGPEDGTLTAFLAATFRRQLVLARHRGDTAKVSEITQILTSHGAALETSATNVTSSSPLPSDPFVAQWQGLLASYGRIQAYKPPITPGPNGFPQPTVCTRPAFLTIRRVPPRWNSSVSLICRSRAFRSRSTRIS